MSAPVRIQRERTKGWRMPEGAVYVGRPTKWGNPYRVEPDAPQIVTHPDGRWWTVASDARSWVVGEFRADLVVGDLVAITVADVVRGTRPPRQRRATTARGRSSTSASPDPAAPPGSTSTDAREENR